MPKYKIYAGLNGSFGGANYIHTTDESYSEEEANLEAYEIACDLYENYESYDSHYHDLRSYSDALVQAESEIFEYNYETHDDWRTELEERANAIYTEYVDDWVDYYVELDNKE